VVAADPLVITTASLPSAGVGNPFSVMLAASGGVTPYLWTLTSGTLPKGLLLSGGTIAGTPQQYGPGSSFTLQVSDTETPAQTATVSFTLPVKNTLTITSTTMPTCHAGNQVFGAGAVLWRAGPVHLVFRSKTGYDATLAPGTITVSSGASGTTTITITPVGGYTGTVTFSCGTLPEYVSCTFAPPSLTIAAGSGQVTDTLTINTSASKSAELQLPSRPGGTGISAVAMGMASLCGLLAPWPLLAGCKRHRAVMKRLLPCLLLFLSLGGLAVLSGCGGTSHNDTPPGTYAVPITVKLGSGSSVSASVSITVQ
jgi:hypothetical protein